MKRCPTCQRTYADDSLTFCLDDGTPLAASDQFDPGATLIDPGATLVMPDSRATSPARPPAETYRPQQPQQPQTSPPPYNMQPVAWSPQMQPRDYSATNARPGRVPAIVSLICIIAAFFTFVLTLVLSTNRADSTLIGVVFVSSIVFGFAGAVVGIIAVVKTGRNPNPQNNRTMAIVALVLNCVYLLIILFLLLLGALATAH